MATKVVRDIAEYIEEALQDDLIAITRTAIGGGLSQDNNIYNLYVTLKSGEKFYISVTKIDED